MDIRVGDTLVMKKAAPLRLMPLAGAEDRRGFQAALRGLPPRGDGPALEVRAEREGNNKAGDGGGVTTCRYTEQI